MHVDDCPGHVFGCAGLDETTKGRMRVERLARIIHVGSDFGVADVA